MNIQSTQTKFKLQLFGLCSGVIFVFNLFYLGAKPIAVGLFPEPWDKLAHFGAFATLAALAWLTMGRRHPLAALCFTLLVGALDEVHQIWLPGRVADIWDFAADACGACTCLATIQTFRRSRRS